ncbi:hypothetical protein [Sagittula sp.]|uniref:hypothetical protein n=1 Tax=Sagittula sp. TaxID=2038081 RepID=UPI003511F60B
MSQSGEQMRTETEQAGSDAQIARNAGGAERFDVFEVEIKNPSNRRLMRGGMDRPNAEAFVDMAVFRRGVTTHYYTIDPATGGIA